MSNQQKQQIVVKHTGIVSGCIVILLLLIFVPTCAFFGGTAWVISSAGSAMREQETMKAATAVAAVHPSAQATSVPVSPPPTSEPTPTPDPISAGKKAHLAVEKAITLPHGIVRLKAGSAVNVKSVSGTSVTVEAMGETFVVPRAELAP
jgi:hypothetical protein